jgi:hypothetical protein
MARGFWGADVSRLVEDVGAAWDEVDKSSVGRMDKWTSGGSGSAGAEADAGAGDREEGVSVILAVGDEANRVLLESDGRGVEPFRHRLRVGGYEGIRRRAWAVVGKGAEKRWETDDRMQMQGDEKG